MPHYTEYTEEQIVEALEACGFERVGVGGTRETVMERKVEGHSTRCIRVLTSAVKGQAARDCGKDAARVQVIVRRGDGNGGIEWRIVWTAKRVHRTQNFLKNLQQRCRNAWKVAQSECPKCGAMMVPRRKKGAKKNTFMGCTRYPNCRGTRSL